MIRIAAAVLALSLAGSAGAEDLYRWRDAAGGLHYSNQGAHVPSDALRLRSMPDGLHATGTSQPDGSGPEQPARRDRARPPYDVETPA